MKLYTGGYLTFYMPERKHSIDIQLNAPTPLRDILAQVGIPLNEVALTAINGEQVELDTVLVKDGDVVRVFSSVDGG